MESPAVKIHPAFKVGLVNVYRSACTNYLNHRIKTKLCSLAFWPLCVSLTKVN